MEQPTKNLIKNAVETLAQATGIKVVLQANTQKRKMPTLMVLSGSGTRIGTTISLYRPRQE